MKTLEADLKTKENPVAETHGNTQTRKKLMTKRKEGDVSVLNEVEEQVEESAFPASGRKGDKGESDQQTLQNLTARLEKLARFTHKKRLFITFIEIFDVISPEGEKGMAAIKEFISGHIQLRFRLRDSQTSRLIKAVEDFRLQSTERKKSMSELKTLWTECLVENGLIAPIE
jgi:hypothetical protein